MFIEKPIVYNPDNDPNEEKIKITNYLHDTMVESYIKNEIENEKLKNNKKMSK